MLKWLDNKTNKKILAMFPEETTAAKQLSFTPISQNYKPLTDKIHLNTKQ